MHAAAPAPRPPDGRRAGPTNPFVEFARAEIEQSIPARFEQQVRRYPDRLAVKTGARALTYAELNRAANRVARAILALRGVQPEPVALLFEHGVGMLVAMLAVLKDGKFYVPLDPSYPYARLAHVLEDSGAGSIVTDEESLPLARSLAGNGREVLNVDSLDAELTGEDLCLPVSPADVASIIYTSGSTGQPKGVIHSHRFILHHIANYTNSVHLAPDDRIVSLYSYSYIGGRGISTAPCSTARRSTRSTSSRRTCPDSPPGSSAKRSPSATWPRRSFASSPTCCQETGCLGSA